MPRVFIDVDDGERHVRDETGIDLMRVEDAAFETEQLLIALGQAEVARGKPRIFSASVRDATGQTIYRGSATLDIEPGVRRRS